MKAMPAMGTSRRRDAWDRNHQAGIVENLFEAGSRKRLSVLKHTSDLPNTEFNRWRCGGAE
jgi:hypothetical protein